MTYRYRGHSMSDPAKYRAAGELEEYKAKDGIKAAGDRLLQEYGVPQSQLDSIKAEIEAEAQDAYSFAEQGTEPDPNLLYDYTYAPEGN